MHHSALNELSVLVVLPSVFSEVITLDCEYHPSSLCNGRGSSKSEIMPPLWSISEYKGLKGGLFANYSFECKRNARATTPFLG